MNITARAEKLTGCPRGRHCVALPPFDGKSYYNIDTEVGDNIVVIWQLSSWPHNAHLGGKG